MKLELTKNERDNSMIELYNREYCQIFAIAHIDSFDFNEKILDALADGKTVTVTLVFDKIHKLMGGVK